MNPERSGPPESGLPVRDKNTFAFGLAATRQKLSRYRSLVTGARSYFQHCIAGPRVRLHTTQSIFSRNKRPSVHPQRVRPVHVAPLLRMCVRARCQSTHADRSRCLSTHLKFFNETQESRKSRETKHFSLILTI